MKFYAYMNNTIPGRRMREVAVWLHASVILVRSGDDRSTYGLRRSTTGEGTPCSLKGDWVSPTPSLAKRKSSPAPGIDSTPAPWHLMIELVADNNYNKNSLKTLK